MNDSPFAQALATQTNTNNQEPNPITFSDALAQASGVNTQTSGSPFADAITQQTGVAPQINTDPTSLIHKYFPPEEWSNAARVMQAESGGKADAIGDNYPIQGQTIPSVGLFQIRTLPGRPSAEELKNPDFNVKYAANLWKSQGWRPWTTAVRMGLAK